MARTPSGTVAGDHVDPGRGSDRLNRKSDFPRSGDVFPVNDFRDGSAFATTEMRSRRSSHRAKCCSSAVGRQFGKHSGKRRSPTYATLKYLGVGAAGAVALWADFNLAAHQPGIGYRRSRAQPMSSPISRTIFPAGARPIVAVAIW